MSEIEQPPTSSNEALLATMNHAAYEVMLAGLRGYPDIYPPERILPGEANIRSGMAYDQTTRAGRNKKAIEYFTAAFFTPNATNNAAMDRFHQVVAEFDGTESREVEARLPDLEKKVPGVIKGRLLFKIFEPEPEIIRERNFILYSLIGHVLIRADYNIGDNTRTIAHGLLTLSRHAHSPAGTIPDVRVGIPARNFKFSS